MRALVFALIMMCGLAAPAHSADAPAPFTTLTVAQQREDLMQLRYTLEHAHPGLYRYNSREKMDQRFQAVAQAIRGPVTDLEFYRRLAPLVQAIRDSHTSIQPSTQNQKFFRSDSRRVFPFDIRYVDDRAFVEADLSDRPTGIAPGSEILAIDGRPMAAITRRLISGMAVDGDNHQSQLERLDASFWYHYSLWFGPKAQYRLRLRDPRTHAIRDLTIAGIPPKRLVERESGPPHETQRLELLGDGTAILTIDELINPGTGDFIRDAFARIAAAHATDLIIDLRKCPGGEDRFNNQLMSFLVDRPFRFYWSRDFVARNWDDLKYVHYSLDDFLTARDVERLPPAERANPLALPLPLLLQTILTIDQAGGVFQPAARDRFTGRVYLLLTGRSGSSSSEIAAIMHHLGVGTIIGEEPLGAYQGLVAGEIPDLVLPNSGVRVRIPLVAYHNAVTPGAFIGRAAPPAFPVSQGLADAIAGTDTVMDFTRRLISARREGESPTGRPPQ